MSEITYRIVEHDGGAGPTQEDVATSTLQFSRHHASGHAARTPKASRHHASSVATPMAQPRASSRASRATARANSGGPLAAARELLRHPPGAGAAPDAMVQWQNDVDRLIHLAQVTPGSSRAGTQPPRSNAAGPRRPQHGDSSRSVHSPTVRSARTEDLRAELNRRRAGEDARVSLERAREHRCNVKGRNLDSDLAATTTPKPSVAARASSGTIVAGVGSAALADNLRTAK